MPRNCGYGRKACATLPTKPGNGTLMSAATACGDVTEAFNSVPRREILHVEIVPRQTLSESMKTACRRTQPLSRTGPAKSVRYRSRIFDARAAFFPPSPPKKFTLDPLSEVGLKLGKGGMIAGNPLFQLNAGSMPLFNVAVPAVNSPAVVRCVLTLDKIRVQRAVNDSVVGTNRRLVVDRVSDSQSGTYGSVVDIVDCSAAIAPSSITPEGQAPSNPAAASFTTPGLNAPMRL